VEKTSRKIGEETYLAPKPSDLPPPSLTHLPHHQEDLAFTFSHKKDKKEARVIVFIYRNISRMFGYFRLHA